MSEKCIIADRLCPNERGCTPDCLEQAIKDFRVATETKNKKQKVILNNRTFTDDFGWPINNELEEM